MLVSATNGKTTTAAMAAAILERSGRSLVHNRAGSNMGWGVATALLDAGTRPGQLGLFEVDEAWLPAGGRRRPSARGPAGRTCSATSSTATASWSCWPTAGPSWWPARPARRGSSSTPTTRWWPTWDATARASTYFGVEDTAQALPELGHAADSKHCRNCGAPYVYDAVLMGHLGHYRCPSCGRERPSPSVVAERRAPRRHVRGAHDPGHAGRARGAAASPARPLQRLQRRRRRGAGPRARRLAGGRP